MLWCVLGVAVFCLAFLLIINLLYPGKIMAMLGFCFLLLFLGVCHAQDIGAALEIDTVGYGPSHFVNLDNYSPVESAIEEIPLSPGPGLQVLMSGGNGSGHSSYWINESALAAWLAGGMRDEGLQMMIC